MAEAETVVYRPPSSNVYTILLVIAFLVLAMGVGFLIWKNGKTFDTGPLDAKAVAATSLVPPPLA